MLCAEHNCNNNNRKITHTHTHGITIGYTNRATYKSISNRVKERTLLCWSMLFSLIFPTISFLFFNYLHSFFIFLLQYLSLRLYLIVLMLSINILNILYIPYILYVLFVSMFPTCLSFIYCFGFVCFCNNHYNLCFFVCIGNIWL